MDISKIPAGTNPPHEVNVIIEIARNSEPVKYEIDKESGALFVDRFMHSSMHYPLDYGFVPHTTADDGDPVDFMVLNRARIIPGAVVMCRPVGVLLMEDEAGLDEKIIGVPVAATLPYYDHIKSYEQVPATLRNEVQHFFEHYKDLEEGKWVKIVGWGDVDQAKDCIQRGIDNENKA